MCSKVMQTHILLTGANGFIGSALMPELLHQGFNVTALVRRRSVCIPEAGRKIVADLSALENLDSDFFSGVDVVVHTAAIAEVTQDNSDQQLNLYRQVNCDATLTLARTLANAKVKRFIFISSIKVNGEVNARSKAFSPDDIPNPIGPYGVSKYEAEQGLLQIAKETGMEVVIIRLPLVYGPGVKGNFASMVKWLKKGLPLPLGAVSNRRSLLAMDNLVNFLVLCTDQEKSARAANEIFILSDGADLSTTQLLQTVAKAYRISPKLIPIPVFFLKFFAWMFGKSSVADRLFGDLCVNSSKAQLLLGWRPIVTMEEQLEKMAHVGDEVQRNVTNF